MPLIIETKNLILRSFKTDDLQALLVLMTDPQVMRFTGFKVPQSEERTRQLLAKWEMEGQGPLGVWAAESKIENQFVGWAMLKPTTGPVPELGYMIAKAQWGKGFATEIASGLLNYADKELGLRTVRAVTSKENTASIRVLEKIGMNVYVESSCKTDEVAYEIEISARGTTNK